MIDRIVVANEELVSDEEVVDLINKFKRTDYETLNQALEYLRESSSRIDEFIDYNRKLAREKDQEFDESKIRLYSLKGDLKDIVQYLKSITKIEDYYTVRDILGLVGYLEEILEETMRKKQGTEKIKLQEQEEKKVYVKDKWFKEFRKLSKEEMLNDINGLYQLYKYLTKLNSIEKYKKVEINKLKSDELEELLFNMNTNIKNVKSTVNEFFIYIRKLLYEELKILENEYPEINIEQLLR